MKFLKIYIRIVAIAAFISVILQYGFTIPNRFTLYILGLNMFIALSFAFNAIVRLVVSPNKLRTIRSNILEYILLFLIILQLLVWHGFWEKLSPYFQNLNIFSLTNLYIITLQLYILATLILKLPSVNAILSGLRIPPPLIVIGSFSFVILLGTLLLLLPKATYMRISFIDALFTATSAVCVTGLVVLDIGRQFTTFGQFIILLLIQVGGLGIMTITSFFALILRGELGIKERRVLGDILNFRTFSQLKTLVSSIFWTTIVIEIIGALLMYTRFTKYQGINDASPLWNAIFHSVSAFCNAGFSLFPRNFAHFVKDKELSFIAMALIVLGGIGFVVIRDILSAVSALLRRRSQVVRLMLQTRIVLKMTLFLIVVGAFVFLIIENNNLLAGLTLTEKLVASLFQSVTARTCGFNTVDIGLISLPAMMLLILLMFIGASPGGTGGGIKTTTAAILAGLIRARFRGHQDVVISGGKVSKENIFEGIVIFTLSLSIIFTSLFLLLITEKMALDKLLFEVVSAFGTVGLSTGITPQLSNLGRLIIILTMLIGRVGPLSIVLAIPTRKYEERVHHPEERIMVG